MSKQTPRATMTSQTTPPPHVAQIIGYFETLTQDRVANLGQVYAPNARFVDPFNDVEGLANIEKIFRHMFVALNDPRFVVTGHVTQDMQCFLLWEFHFRFKGFQKHTLQTIRGTSHLVFADTGLVTLHRDYWDAAQELYEKLPLLGGLMRWLRRRANT